MRPLVHVGFHKTGTTWFQDQLYPFVKNGRFVARQHVREHLLLPRPFDFRAQRARDTLTLDAGDRVLVCDEELSGNIHTAGHHGCLTKEMALRVREVFGDADVVIFLRNQLSMVPSVYAQYVRMGGTYSLERYLAHPGFLGHRAPLFDLGHFDYFDFARFYAGLFGVERVHVYLYEAFLREPRKFVSGFCEELRLDVDSERLSYSAVNQSLAPATLTMARFLNRFTSKNVLYKQCFVDIPGYFEASRTALDHLDRLVRTVTGGRASRPLLTDSMKSSISDRFRSGNARLASEFRLPLAEFGYPVE